MSQLFPGAVVEPVELAEAKGLVCIRTASASDVENLSVYFTGLSATSRNKRFSGARADPGAVAAECIAKSGGLDHFTLLAELREDGRGRIVGEARYAYDAAARHGEFAISVADAFQRNGVGLQMMTAMETLAIDLGHEMIAAETARTNAEMRGLARKAGFSDTGLGDWQSVHLAKRLSR
ncbi:MULTISPECIES: GNAT family N-acetyltransferase [Bradyrhizobium]|uniref:Acetyltransferase n=1 Tax=Bradyrhizobium nanningense TaxID=1325118 RepID=A0A4Q0RUN0_9BRAD|nr:MULTISPECIES: GNAT family N-acetyltransferase [Bradyrhizobium]RXH21511.1 acetyltransferase [Bradyrhizobium nanningense]RXH30472.1 acetyltransferase [Bradyrhizobium nanningense]TQF31586.1 acetyltransferase [Bradyrhizobium sp. UNPA324]